MTSIDAQQATEKGCRFCGSPLEQTFVNLGMSPPCQTHIEHGQLNEMEPFYPLHVLVCCRCFLVQLREFVAPEKIFTEYAYFSSYSDSWLDHCRQYCELMMQKFDLGTTSKVVEIASNDGYLLQYFVKAGVPVLGVEPAENVAVVARSKGINTVSKFLGERSATEIVKESGQGDLVLGNNVLAHVPDLNDFVAGIRILLKPNGVLTMEFPHLVELMENNQFDTIYHEHFSYISFTTAEKVFAAHGIRLFDVERLPTHGGSIRIYGCHQVCQKHTQSDRVFAMKRFEDTYGITKAATYTSFTKRVESTKRDILDLLIQLKRQDKKIVGYGAPGKGNTLLNYCGIRTDFLDFTVDLNPYKQGKFTPGTHIPIYEPARTKLVKPDYVFILPWNLKEEIIRQNSFIREWGGKFIVPIPKVEVV